MTVLKEDSGIGDDGGVVGVGVGVDAAVDTLWGLGRCHVMGLPLTWGREVRTGQ